MSDAMSNSVQFCFMPLASSLVSMSSLGDTSECGVPQKIQSRSSIAQQTYDRAVSGHPTSKRSAGRPLYLSTDDGRAEGIATQAHLPLDDIFREVVWALGVRAYEERERVRLRDSPQEVVRVHRACIGREGYQPAM